MCEACVLRLMLGGPLLLHYRILSQIIVAVARCRCYAAITAATSIAIAVALAAAAVVAQEWGCNE